MEALQWLIIPNARPTGVKLGRGSYGFVEEVEANGLICAGKIIHETLIDRENVGAKGIARKYVEECQLMSDLRHPHLVQFLGVCFLPNSTLPVLVMERLLTSLDELLEHNPDIPLSLKRSILADVAKGLVYLHSRSPPVIHRDLSAKNVLLNSAMVAKIADLGNARIVNFQPSQLAQTLTRIPGTTVYMPPEAFDKEAHYGPKLDSFSFGHLALFAITQVFPGDLLTHNYPDPRNPDRLLARTEVQRRGEYIQSLHRQLGDQHPLVQLVEQCLHNTASRRPSAQELLQQLEDVQAQIEDPFEHLTKLEAMKQLRDKDEKVQHLQLQVQASTEEIISLQDHIKQLQLDKYSYDAETEKILARKDAEISRLMDDIGNVQEQNLHVVEMLESDLEAKKAEISRLMGELQHFQSQIILSPGAPVKWTPCAQLPIDGTHSSQAVVVKNKVCVGGGETAMYRNFSIIYIYDFSGDSWKAIQGPTIFSALAAYREKLVLVGGKDTTTFEASNQVWVLEEDEQTWTQPLPAMTTPKVRASVASFDNHLIVAGSQEVEIYDGKEWTVTCSCPEACYGVVSSTVHKGHFYLMHYNRRVVFYASLESLIEQVKSGKHQSLWNTLPSAPYVGCSIGSFGGSIVAIGGSGKKDCFHMYDPLTQSWVLAGKMSLGTQFSCTTTLPNGDLLVIMGDDATIKGATWSPLVYKASLQSH